MSEFFERPADPVDALLAAPSASASDFFQQKVLARTTAVLRRRRRFKQLARLTGLAACYVAGLLTMHGSRPVEPLGPAPVVTAAAPPTEAVTALDLEWEAIDHPEQAGTLYRAAGDRYLAVDTDPGAATRCYGNALENGPAEELTIQPTDSWLLMAIKDARQREKQDANRVQ
jgi:hypothetical protein